MITSIQMIQTDNPYLPIGELSGRMALLALVLGKA